MLYPLFFFTMRNQRAFRATTSCHFLCRVGGSNSVLLTSPLATDVARSFLEPSLPEWSHFAAGQLLISVRVGAQIQYSASGDRKEKDVSHSKRIRCALHNESRT